MDYASIGSTLRKARKARGLSQDAVATVIGVERSNVSYIERGASRAPLDLLERFATAVGVRFVVSAWPEDDPRADILGRIAVLFPRLPAEVVRTLSGLVDLWERDYPAGTVEPE